MPLSLRYDSRVKCVSEMRQTSILCSISVTWRSSLCWSRPLAFHARIRRVLAIVILYEPIGGVACYSLSSLLLNAVCTCACCSNFASMSWSCRWMSLSVCLIGCLVPVGWLSGVDLGCMCGGRVFAASAYVFVTLSSCGLDMCSFLVCGACLLDGGNDFVRFAALFLRAWSSFATRHPL